jgi:imidazolonepropionase-like amidohydrolase
MITKLSLPLLLALGIGAPLTYSTPHRTDDPVTAIVGGTIIDGNGGTPLQNGTILIRGKRIVEVGPSDKVKVPTGAKVIDAAGKFITPGFIDTNVHISMYNGGETMVRYEGRFDEIVEQTAQLELKHGITTVRDSYGMLGPLIKVRDKIARGELVGPRMLVAGNIVGWGGPWSATFSGGSRGYPTTLFEERMNDSVTHGSGEELLDMPPDELRVAINKYLDKGVDFVKYGGTSHVSSLITFSPRQQKVIVEEVSKRGKVAETHSTSNESLLIALNAGIQVVQHPEATNTPISDEVVKMLRDKKVVCSSLVGWGKEAKQDTAAKRKADSVARADSLKLDSLQKAGKKIREKTGAERRAEERKKWGNLMRKNLIALVKGGCIMSVATDTYLQGAPEYSKQARTDSGTMPGLATLTGIKTLVELGMTPMQAITAGTKNGAIACNALKDYGTLEVGKFADIAILDADPTVDIANIHKLNSVIKEGQVVDIAALPTKKIWVDPWDR